jgi:1-acyl-sn-glycerol-3-phosphate acyltransferase
MREVAALLRSVAYELLRFAITVIFAVISLLTFAFKPITRYRIITAWSHLVVGMAWVICGVRYRVIGKDNLPASPAIVLSKHQSAWETLAYQIILPPQVWVLKRELLRVPFFGWDRR